jgi:hemerythrin-like metal-binding protein
MLSKIPTLGIELLDREHRDLILFATQIKTDKKDINKILIYFLDIVQYHFFHEEAFMNDKKYDSVLFDEHLKDHQKLRFYFIEELISLQRDIEDKERVEKLLQSFCDELVTHMDTFDVILSDWLKMKK